VGAEVRHDDGFTLRWLTFCRFRLIVPAILHATVAATIGEAIMEFPISGWLQAYGRILLQVSLIAGLAIWCLWAVNWRRAWPVLAAGGWAPLVLIGLMAAAVWSLIWPAPANIFGWFILMNGFWQLMAVTLLIGLILFCGWLQSRTSFVPHEFNLDEPANGHHDHGHDHAHAHH
jgi:hypothetical protein